MRTIRYLYNWLANDPVGQAAEADLGSDGATDEVDMFVRRVSLPKPRLNINKHHRLEFSAHLAHTLRRPPRTALQTIRADSHVLRASLPISIPVPVTAILRTSFALGELPVK